MRTVRMAIAFLCLVPPLVACGGGGGGDSPPPPPPPPPAQFAVGGAVSGLSGAGLTLQLNGAGALGVSANGQFTFPSLITSGQQYTVTVSAQPTAPWQTCTVASGAGTVGNGNVSNVAVTCTTNAYAVGGSVSGLNGSGLTLQVNGGNDHQIAANGAYAFPAAVPSGASYSVTVRTHPSSPRQRCEIDNRTGTVSGSAVTNVAVQCTNVLGYAYVTSWLDATVSAYAIADATGALMPLGPSLETPMHPGNVTIGANGKFAFVGSHGTALQAYRIDANNGTLALAGPLQFFNVNWGAPVWIVIEPTGRRAYINHLGVQSSTVVTAHTIDQDSAELSFINLHGGVTYGFTIALDPAARFVYQGEVPPNRAGRIAGRFAVDAVTGALSSPSSDIVPGDGLWQFAVHPSGDYAYSANITSGDVSAYSVDQTTGGLTSIGTAATFGEGPETLVVHPSGNFVYVGGKEAGDTLAAYSVDATTGELTRINAGLTHTLRVTSLAVDASGRFLLAANYSGTDISVFAIDPATGALTAAASGATISNVGFNHIAIAE